MTAEISLNTQSTGSIQGSGITQSSVLNNAIAITTNFGGTGTGAGPIDLLVA